MCPAAVEEVLGAEHERRFVGTWSSDRRKIEWLTPPRISTTSPDPRRMCRGSVVVRSQQLPR
jgi:hypothetical protein